MKKFSLLGLLWLLAFVATPIYAEDDVYFDEGYIVVKSDEAEVSDATTNDELDYWLNEDGITLEIADEEAIVEDTTDLDEDLVLIPDFDISDAFVEEIWGELSSSNLNPVIVALAWWFWFAIWILIYLLFAYFSLLPISYREIYRRAGKKGWAWLVPFWGTMVYSEIAGMSKWLWLLPWLWAICTYLVVVLPTNTYSILMTVFGIITLIWLIVANYRIARRYGWSIFPSILHALIIFCPITVLVLWLWNYKYQWKSEVVVDA